MANQKRVRGLPVDGERFSNLRALRRISQEDLAGLEVSVTTIRRMEQGGLFDEKTVRYVADKLGVAPREILAGRTEHLCVDDRPRVVLNVDLSMSQFAERWKIDAFIDMVRGICGMVGLVVVINVIEGSVLITLELDDDDLNALVRAFANDELPKEIVSVVVNSGEEVFEFIFRDGKATWIPIIERSIYARV